MGTSNISHYKELLNHLAFDKLEEELLTKSLSEMEDILNQIAYDRHTGEGNYLVYSFLMMVMVKKETSEMHLLISRLMGTILVGFNQAEKIGLYHGLRAADLDPENIDLLEYLLYFNHIPEKPLEDSKAFFFAKKVIGKYPDSLAAKMTLGDEWRNEI